MHELITEPLFKQTHTHTQTATPLEPTCLVAAELNPLIVAHDNGDDDAQLCGVVPYVARIAHILCCKRLDPKEIGDLLLFCLLLSMWAQFSRLMLARS